MPFSQADINYCLSNYTMTILRQSSTYQTFLWRLIISISNKMTTSCFEFTKPSPFCDASKTWWSVLLGWELLKQFPPFRYFLIFSALSKHKLAVEYYIYIWQVSPQLRCGDTCQYECDSNNLKGTFARSKILLTEKSTNVALATPTAVLWLVPILHPFINASTLDMRTSASAMGCHHYKVTIWKHFPHYWPFCGEIERPLVDSPHKGQGVLMRSWICAWTNNRDAGDLICHQAHYDVTVMILVNMHLILVICIGFLTTEKTIDINRKQVWY